MSALPPPKIAAAAATAALGVGLAGYLFLRAPTVSKYLKAPCLQHEFASAHGCTLRVLKGINSIDIEVAEVGDRNHPMVLLCHGWPESWGSWAKVMAPIAAQGYHVVAPSMRGYGFTSAPKDPNEYRIDNICADAVGLVRALGHSEVECVVGHDWGAIVAWQLAELEPEFFKSVYCLSVPISKFGLAPNESELPVDSWAKKFGENFFYICYHNEIDGKNHEFDGPAAREYDLRKEELHDRMFQNFGAITRGEQGTFLGRAKLVMWSLLLSPAKKRSAGGVIDRIPPAFSGPPDWLNHEHREFWLNQAAQSKFHGPVNYYRNFNANNLYLKEQNKFPRFVGQAHVGFLAGTDDVVITGMCPPDWKEQMAAVAPGIKREDGTDRITMVQGASHWVMLESPVQVSEAIQKFLAEKKTSSSSPSFNGPPAARL